MTTSAGLDPQQIAAFERDGFIHVRGVIREDELVELRGAAASLAEQAQRDGDHCFQRDPASGRDVLHRINDVHAKHAAFLRLWGNPRLLAIAGSLHGPDILPLALSLVMKTPGFGVAVPWHRDPAHCRLRHGLNVGVYLDDADAENGMLHAIPGSHRRRLFDLGQAVARHGFDLPGAISVPTRAGDLIIHSENVLHGSREVRSQRQRRVLYFGVRTIHEQLADRGLGLDWIRSVGQVLQSAIAARAAAPIGRGETPYAWAPTVPGAKPEPAQGAPASLRILGHNSPPSPQQQLRFADESALAAR